MSAAQDGNNGSGISSGQFPKLATGEHLLAQNPIQSSPSGESVSIKLPFNLKDALPYFFLVILGGDRIFSEYINAPAKIKDLEAQISALNNSVDQRLRNIERALNVPTTQPSYRP